MEVIKVKIRIAEDVIIQPGHEIIILVCSECLDAMYPVCKQFSRTVDNMNVEIHG